MTVLILLISVILALQALDGWPDPTGGWIRALVALACLLLGLGAVALLTPCPKAGRFQSVRKPGALDRFTTAVFIATLIGLLYSLLVVAPPAARQFSEFLSAATKERAQRSLSQRQATDGGPTGDGQDRQNIAFEISTVYDPAGALVPKSAKLTASEMPQVSLRMFSKQAAERLRDSGASYLHSFSHNVFDGERWTTLGSAEPVKLTAGADGLIHLQSSAEAAAYEYAILHHRRFREDNTVSFLSGVRHLRLPEITQMHPGTWLLPPPADLSSRGYEYQAGSSPRRFRDLVASGVAIEPGEVDAVHLAPTIHSGLNLQIQGIARRFQSDASLERRLIQLQAWLSSAFTYSLTLDDPGGDASALENFLGEPGGGRGFCVHFASAAALLVREMGVPSRVCYGWMGGEHYEGRDLFVFRGGDAHAWAEIYLKDQGWVIFETTPSAALPQSVTAPPGAAPPVVEETGEPLEDESVVAEQAGEAPSWKWLAVALGAAAGLLFILQGLKRSQSARGSTDPTTAADGAPPGYLQLFHQVCAGLGHPRPCGSTLLAHLEQLRRDQVSLPFADELVAYHYGVTYREAPRDPRFERHLCRQIKALQEAARA